MKANLNRQEYNQHIIDIQFAVTIAIDEVCKRYDYKIMEIEIIGALIKVITDSHNNELKSLLKKPTLL